jgi:hypothetical protein
MCCLFWKLFLVVFVRIIQFFSVPFYLFIFILCAFSVRWLHYLFIFIFQLWLAAFPLKLLVFYLPFSWIFFFVLFSAVEMRWCVFFKYHTNVNCFHINNIHNFICGKWSEWRPLTATMGICIGNINFFSKREKVQA